MADKNDAKNIPGSMQPSRGGDAAGEALRRLGAASSSGKGGKVGQAAGDAASVATAAAKGAAGGTLASKAVGGGAQGAAVQGVITALGTGTGKKAARTYVKAVAFMVAVPALLLGPTLMGGMSDVAVRSAEPAVTQERAHEAAEESGYDPDRFETVYSEASRHGVEWEPVAAIAHWQETRNTQRYCAPPVLRVPLGGEPAGNSPATTTAVEPPAYEDAEIQLVDGTAHPVTGSEYRIASTFGTEIDTGDSITYNTGLDFSDATGTALVAASSGVVSYSGWNGRGGNMVWVDLRDGAGAPWVPATQLRYMHLDGVNVAVGDTLTAGDFVGTLGDTGTATRPILHFEVLEANEHVDPAVWLNDRDIVVNHGLPVDSSFADPCAAQGGTPVAGGIGGGGYEGAEGFPGAPPPSCPTFPQARIMPGVNQGIGPDTRRALNCAGVAFPNILLTSARRTGASCPTCTYRSDHQDGNALDLAMGQWEQGTPGWAYMYTLAHWAQVNADNLGISYIIFADWTWRRETGWVVYDFFGGGSSPSQRHLDHVHLSFYGSSSMPDAQNLVPALTDGSGMAYTGMPGPSVGHPRFGTQFYPIDNPQLDLSDFPTDGSGGLLVGGGGSSFVAGDYRGPYKIDRKAFGPESEEEQALLMQQIVDDADFRRDWYDRERRGFVAVDFEDAEKLAERATDDFEWATEWVAFHLYRELHSQGTTDQADLDAGRTYDTETLTVSIGDEHIAGLAQDAYVDAIAELPLAAISSSSAGAIFGIAQSWRFGEPSGNGSVGGGAGVICTPAAGDTLTVTPTGPRFDPVPMDAKKLGYAATAVHVAKQNDINDNGMVAMLMTILQESTFNMYANLNVPASLNLPHDSVGQDHDSTGLFQQRGGAVGWAWGPLESNMDVARSTSAFLGVSSEATAPGLTDVPGWQSMHPGQLAQRVQVSAHPTFYNQWENAARQILGHVEGIPCD